MLNMKKDMGGAATMMAVAAMVMAAKLPVRLRLLVPAVENSVSGNAFRPIDVVADAQGHHRRDRQHRRRGPVDPVAMRCTKRVGEAHHDGRLRDADGAARVSLAPTCRRCSATTTRWPTA
jgi:hypothetical protein